MSRDGLVIKSTGSWYDVEDLSSSIVFRCRIRGKIRLDGLRTTNPVSVGDRVVFEMDENHEGTGVIVSIEKRRNYIIRRSTNLSRESHIIAANVDNVFLVATLDFPKTNTEFIDRFLVTCEMYKVPVTIVLNKMDIFSHPDFREVIDDFIKIYNNAGYNVLEVSALKGQGIEQIEKMLNGNISLFSGNSGVGKSTLISAIAPDLSLKTGEISDAHNRGKHTTTFSEMFKIGSDTYIVDTPGIKGFGLIDVTSDELARYMPDLFSFSENCAFHNCTHTHEPRCAVKAAIESGELPEERYANYLKMLDDDNETKYRR